MKMPSRPKPDLNPNTSSMGDIAFLLIIFFMLTTTISDESALDIKPPSAEHLETISDQPKIVFAIDHSEKTFYNGKQKDMSPEDLSSAVEKDLEGVNEPNKRTVMFMCDKDVTRGTYEAYIGAISRAGAKSILMGATGVPEE